MALAWVTYITIKKSQQGCVSYVNTLLNHVMIGLEDWHQVNKWSNSIFFNCSSVVIWSMVGFKKTTSHKSSLKIYKNKFSSYLFGWNFCWSNKNWLNKIFASVQNPPNPTEPNNILENWLDHGLTDRQKYIFRWCPSNNYKWEQHCE